MFVFCDVMQDVCAASYPGHAWERTRAQQCVERLIAFVLGRTGTDLSSDLYGHDDAWCDALSKAQRFLHTGNRVCLLKQYDRFWLTSGVMAPVWYQEKCGLLVHFGRFGDAWA